MKLRSARAAIFAAVACLPVACDGGDCQPVDPMMPVCLAALHQLPQPALVFSSTREDDDWEIYTLDERTGAVVRLTYSPGEDLAPRWSPDGQRIVFHSRRDGNNEIYVMNADGTDVRNLTQDPGQDSNASWSPDGRHIVFESTRNGNYDVHIMNADGSNVRALTRHPENEGAPRFSPDGRQIAFTSGRSGYWQIYLMDADGRNGRPLTLNGANTGAAWSPDGRYIVYLGMRLDDMAADTMNWEIYVMRADGRHATNLTRTRADEWRPVWARSGEIYFSSMRDGPRFQIYAMSPDGGNVRRVMSHEGEDDGPDVRQVGGR